MAAGWRWTSSCSRSACRSPLAVIVFVLGGCGQATSAKVQSSLQAEASVAAEEGQERSCAADGGGECTSGSEVTVTPMAEKAARTEKAAKVRWKPKTLSVVLPCASEGKFVENTARAVAESVPGGRKVLVEIIVVDDGSKPPVNKTFPVELQDELGVRIVRHEKAKGLILAKSAGAAVTKGDVIVFFDCHVAPQPGWHKLFLKAMAENYRRIVVPSITDLDIDTWKQRSKSAPVSKCYLTWDADFKWLNSESDHIPILSGGLLAISSRWWKETGGYDDQMLNWGGENIDQSLRTWLCGGEIVAVAKAEVAHMWRSEDDKRTQANYRVNMMNTLRNRARAAKGWYGNFSVKLSEYPDMERIGWQDFDVSAFQKVKDRLNCKPFAWFLHRFKDVYEDAGLVPVETFRLQHTKSGKCLTYMGPPGTHPQGKDQIQLKPCGKPIRNMWGQGPSDPQRWHLANRLPETAKCCSGLRAWNTDQCLGFASRESAGTTICELSGRNDQLWRLSGNEDDGLAVGQLFHPRGYCVKHAKGDNLKLGECNRKKKSKAKPTWKKVAIEVPMERKLYVQAKEDQPELFVDTWSSA